jgi:hypothetical protein
MRSSKQKEWGAEIRLTIMKFKEATEKQGKEEVEGKGHWGVKKGWESEGQH